MRSLTAVIAVFTVAGCATIAVQEFDRRYGQPDPARFDTPAVPVAGGVSYRHDVQPIFERRCVACHGCYDAPCQLKLTAWEGVARGLSPQPVYDADRLVEAPPTRLFTDAQLPSQWRTRGFSPVLNERTPTPANNTAASLLYRSLALKTEHPLPTTPVLSGAFDFSLDRKATCPRIETFDAYAKEKPLAGMPYGLPGLEPREVATIARWLEAGAPYDGDVPLTPLQQQQVQAWEAFLNGPSDRERLMSRYVYEHLFLGHVVFANDPTHRAFRLVRSTTPSGQPVAVIATRRPYDDPGTARFYYRLEP
ncbi:MAG: fatty acid cis/trans isomerase, partial [Betaproteobacteria bacterium]